MNNPNLIIFGSGDYTMEHLRNLKIAVDFDGTIVEHEYPDIGKDMMFAFETLKELQKHGALLILWTFRVGGELDEAIEYCRKKGVEFHAINANYPEEVYDVTVSRKINADIYIDDKNVGGFIGWSEVWQLLSLYSEREKEIERQLRKGRPLFSRIIRFFKTNKQEK